MFQAFALLRIVGTPSGPQIAGGGVYPEAPLCLGGAPEVFVEICRATAASFEVAQAACLQEVRLRAPWLLPYLT